MLLHVTVSSIPGTMSRVAEAKVRLVLHQHDLHSEVATGATISHHLHVRRIDAEERKNEHSFKS